jgi:hypothetical protein
MELYLAASHAALGHMGDAQKAISRALELDPEATITKWTSPESAHYSDPNDLEHFAAGLRMAGLPD